MLTKQPKGLGHAIRIPSRRSRHNRKHSAPVHLGTALRLSSEDMRSRASEGRQLFCFAKVLAWTLRCNAAHQRA